MEKLIGQRLKQLRLSRSMSQRQLARLSGVANATISQIEAGKINPTVSMLKKILDGFPIGLGAFFNNEFERQGQVFFRSNELTDIADGGISYRQVGGDLREKAIQLLQESYQPGSGTGKHALTHEGEEGGVVLRGHLEVTVGEQRQVLRAGDAYYFQSSQPHQFRNIGTDVCEVISACTPPTF